VSELCPKYDVVFIDEAQDLSPIQWKMFDLLKKNSKYVILAGDDDQAIYGWAGADVKRFQQEPAKEIVLPQSYRVPKQVQRLANKILDRIPDERKIKKNWRAREEEGFVNYITSIEDVPLHKGKWLVLARYNDKLIKLKPVLREMGIYFEYKNRKSYKTRLYAAILNYTRWTNGSLLSLSECRDLFEYFGKEFPQKEERMYDLKEFDYAPTQQWFEVFETEPEDSLYLRDMLQSGEKLSKDARVKLSTIHAAKGGEADNVLLILDNTKTIREAIEKSQDKEDEENRVWYVGVTRTKQNLYIMAAKREDQGYDIESLQ
jgi:DNA helicase-2/ATP-dependent DNA helicase PcrA